MMFGQQPYVYQQPIYNQPPMPPMQEPMMRPQPLKACRKRSMQPEKI